MYTKIAVGLDGSATAGEAVRTAAELARRFEAELFLLSAFATAKGVPAGSAEQDWASSPTARQRAAIDRTESQLREQGVRARSMIAEGDAGDVLVVGSKGMHRRVLGSVPNTVTHKAGCSVLVVKTA